MSSCAFRTILQFTQQILAFLDYAKQHHLFPLFYVQITTGLRIGETLGLRWDDLDGHKLRIERSLKRQSGAFVLSSTKTQKGRRAVTLAEDTLNVLEAHRDRQQRERELVGDAWEHPGHMFTSEIGIYLFQRNVQRVWHRLQKEAGVPHARLHDARDMHVSLLIKHGVDARTIADRIGHTNPAFTLRQYAHVFEEQRAAAAVPLSDLLAKDKDQDRESEDDT